MAKKIDVNCSYCNGLFHRKDLLKKHIEKKHPIEFNQEISCKYCSNKVLQKDASGIFYCSQSCAQKDKYNDDMTLIPLEHKFSFINFEENKKDILNGKCPHCEKSYSSLSKLKRHIFKNHTKKTGECFNCKEKNDGSFGIGAYCSLRCANSITSKLNFRIINLKDKFSFINFEENKKEIIDGQCPHCEYKSSTLAKLKKHIFKIHTKKTDKCYNCKERHDNSFGIGAYCSKSCANRVSRNKNLSLTKDLTICKFCKEKISKKEESTHIKRVHKDININCKNCNKTIKIGDSIGLFCSNECLYSFREIKKIKENRFEDLSEGLVKKLIIKEQKGFCNRCKENKWEMKDIPLELEHKDGNHSNNKKENVECLCPNCHSLTPTWRGRNKKNNLNKKELFTKNNLLPIYKKTLSLEKTLEELNLELNLDNKGFLKTRLKTLDILFIEKNKLSSNDKKYACHHCDKKYKDMGTLSVHIKKSHQDLKGNKNFKCKSCLKSHDGLYGVGECCSLSCSSKYGHLKSKIKKEPVKKYSLKEAEKLILESINNYYINRKKEIMEADFSTLKFDILRERIFYEQEGKCNHCSRLEWQGKAIILELEHRDGNHHNDERSNVELICANCHSLTPTWRGSNSMKKDVSDTELVKAYQSKGTIRKALLLVGMAAKGGNYTRVKRVLDEAGVIYQLNGKKV